MSYTSYMWWPVAVVLFYSFQAYLSVKNSQSSDWTTFFMLWFIGACFPLWPLISRYSKNLLFDGLLYDLLLILAYVTVFICLENRQLSATNCAGLALTILGLLLLKL